MTDRDFATSADSPREVEATLPLPPYDPAWTPPDAPSFDPSFELYRTDAPAPADAAPHFPPPVEGSVPAWGRPAPVRRPASHLVGAALATVFLCFPLGAVALYHALRVDPLFDAGDVAGARTASDKAGAWLVWAVALGLATVALVIMFFLSRR